MTFSKKHFNPYLMLILAGAIATAPMFVWGIPASRDFLHHFRLSMAFYDSMSNGNFYPGWLSESNSGFGDVSVRFYPPALSYLIAGGKFLFGNWNAAFKMVLLLITIIGGIGTYWWAKAVTASKYAVCAGIIFIFTPYHINQLYQSSLLAEYLGISILPFALGFTERLCQRGNKLDVAGLGLSYAFLILSSLPLAVIGTYTLCFYLLLRISHPYKITLINFTLGVGLGLMASSCFLFTVIAEISYLRPDNEAYFSFNNFLFSTFVSRGNDTSIWYGNLLFIATLLLFLPALIIYKKEISNISANGSSIKALIILTLISLLMTTPLSYPVWFILPKLQSVQLPWRWLAIGSISGSVLIPCTIPFLIRMVRSDKRPLALILLGSIAASIVFTFSHPIREARYLTPDEMGKVIDIIPGFPSIGPWYPKWANENFTLMSKNVSIEGRDVKIINWQPVSRLFEIGSGESKVARVKTFYYPYWIASAMGKPLDTYPDKDGALLIAVPDGETHVELYFQEPRRSTYFNIISLVGFIGIVAIAVFDIKYCILKRYFSKKA
jgi:uncharacterized membrane protein